MPYKYISLDRTSFWTKLLKIFLKWKQKSESFIKNEKHKYIIRIKGVLRINPLTIIISFTALYNYLILLYIKYGYSI